MEAIYDEMTTRVGNFKRPLNISGSEQAKHMNTTGEHPSIPS